MDKNFIIVKEDYDFERKIRDFIDKTFGDLGDLVLKRIDTICDFGMYEDNIGNFYDELTLGVSFYHYKYENKAHGQIVESFSMSFEYKGKKPFYVDNKFVAYDVYEWTLGCPIQQHDKIYGICKNELYDMFGDWIMDC